MLRHTGTGATRRDPQLQLLIRNVPNLVLLDIARNTKVAAENIIIEHTIFVCPIIICELRVPDRVASRIQLRHRLRTTLL